MGSDLYEVIRAAATKPFGFVPYYRLSLEPASQLIPSTSPGKHANTACIRALLNWQG